VPGPSGYPSLNDVETVVESASDAEFAPGAIAESTSDVAFAPGAVAESTSDIASAPKVIALAQSRFDTEAQRTAAPSAYGFREATAPFDVTASLSSVFTPDVIPSPRDPSSAGFADPTPSVMGRGHDELTQFLEERSLGNPVETPEPTPPSFDPKPNAAAALSQALFAVQKWIAEPSEASGFDANNESSGRVNPVFLPGPRAMPVATERRLEPLSDATLPSFNLGPKLSIGRIEIEIVRPQVQRPSPERRPAPETRSAPRVSASAQPSAVASRQSGLDAKRNFGMRQR
jgi:hypothetical protein